MDDVRRKEWEAKLAVDYLIACEDSAGGYLLACRHCDRVYQLGNDLSPSNQLRHALAHAQAHRKGEAPE